MVKNARGVSNIGCLLLLAIIAGGFYVGYKFAMVQWNLESFKEQMTESTRYYANESAPEAQAIKNDVIRRAEQCGFDLAPEDISVSFEGHFLTVTASWVEPIIFPGGYVYNRQIEVERRIKKLGY